MHACTQHTLHMQTLHTHTIHTETIPLGGQLVCAETTTAIWTVSSRAIMSPVRNTNQMIDSQVSHQC